MSKARKLTFFITLLIIALSGCVEPVYVEINNESELSGAINKDVTIYAELYHDKLPTLKLGETWIYLFPKNSTADTAADFIDAFHIPIGNGSLTVKVRGHLSVYDSKDSASQLIDGTYQLVYDRMDTVKIPKNTDDSITPAECSEQGGYIQSGGVGCNSAEIDLGTVSDVNCVCQCCKYKYV